MSACFFLSISDIVEIHNYQIEHFGGSDGIRDWEPLNSAVNMPQVTFGGVYLHSNIFEMGAAYLYHLVENHPFVDGNKRVGAMAALVFLDLNGYNFTAPQSMFTELVMSVAQGRCTKPEIAIFLKNYSIKR